MELDADRVGPTRRRERHVARLVTLALTGAMLAVALTGSEFWPLSAFELFSGVRDGERTSYELRAIDTDGDTPVVSLSELRARHPEAGDPAQHLLGLPADEQAAAIRRWLATAGHVEAVGGRVDRVVRRFDLSGDGSTREVYRVTVVEVVF